MMIGSTPKTDGFRMPAEYERQDRIWMCWPYRTDVWRDNAAPAGEAFAKVASAISEFEPVIMIADESCYEKARQMLPKEVTVELVSYDDAWARDIGPTFLVNESLQKRACDWKFNAWGGEYDGLYDYWENDDRLAAWICNYLGIDRYRTDDFVLEGGSFHVDGEGTAITTEMCLLSKGRNPHLTRSEIEDHLKMYLNLEKVIWLKDGIDPDETNGHVDDIACFSKPGEVICINEENSDRPYYDISRSAIKILENSVDARNRKIKVRKLCCPQKAVTLPDDYSISSDNGAKGRSPGDVCPASYANFLLVNGGVIVPQFGDENDQRAVYELSEIFPDRKVVGVDTREIIYGGGNIHCITQQEPLSKLISKTAHKDY